MISSVLNMLENTLKSCPDKNVILEKNNSMTFSQLYKRSIATAHILKDLGIKKGDRIGICMSKSIDQVVSILGVLYAK